MIKFKNIQLHILSESEDENITGVDVLCLFSGEFTVPYLYIQYGRRPRWVDDLLLEPGIRAGLAYELGVMAGNIMKKYDKRKRNTLPT